MLCMNNKTRKMRKLHMENSMNLTTKPINEMTKSEREYVKYQINERDKEDMQKEIEELKNAQKKNDERISLVEDETKKKTNAITETKKFIDVLGFAVNSYKLQILKGKATSRVYSLFNNDVTSIEYLVWNSYFFKKIYSDIAHHFRVNKCANINVENFEEACYLAENWTPSDYYIHEKIKEMKNRVTTGTLKQERVMALNMYLKLTDNGEINPFVV